jgi:hypothetical protein
MADVLASAPRRDTVRATWLRRIQRLATFGRLHKELVPFLWPGGESDGENASLSKAYWEWVRKQDEGELWPRAVAMSKADDRVVRLLKGCDVLHHSGKDEYLAPALLADTQRNKLDARAFALPEGCIEKRLQMLRLPDGFVSRLIVQMARDHSHLDFTDTMAALYDRALIVQMFVVDGERQQQQQRQHRREVTTMHIFASTKRQMEQVEQHLRKLHYFFSGMVCVDKQGKHSRELKLQDMVNKYEQEPIQVQFIQAECAGEEETKDEKEKKEETISEQLERTPLPLRKSRFCLPISFKPSSY